MIFSLFREKFEIINADSMQVYRGMDIGSAKPDPSFCSLIPHHLIDIKTPDCQFSAGEFVPLADKTIKEIISRGKLPVISGGTAFYFRNYLFGLPESPRVEISVRNKIQLELRLRGLPSLYQELQKLDPQRAGEINPRDRYRVSRALEVYRFTGRPISSYRVSVKMRSDITPFIIGLQRERSELYSRINTRVDVMFKNGLVEEVKRLISMGYRSTDPGMKGIGYGEFFLQRRTGEMTLSDVSDMIKQNSRRYAKRQITFFNKIPGVRWFHPEDSRKIRKVLEEFCLRNEKL